MLPTCVSLQSVASLIFMLCGYISDFAVSSGIVEPNCLHAKKSSRLPGLPTCPGDTARVQELCRLPHVTVAQGISRKGLSRNPLPYRQGLTSTGSRSFKGN